MNASAGNRIHVREPLKSRVVLHELLEVGERFRRSDTACAAPTYEFDGIDPPIADLALMYKGRLLFELGGEFALSEIRTRPPVSQQRAKLAVSR